MDDRDRASEYKRSPVPARNSSRAFALALATTLTMLAGSSCRCGGDPDSADEGEQPRAADVDAPGSPYGERPPQRRRKLVLADAGQIADADLSAVEELDLAMSELDRQERPLPLPEPQVDPDGEPQPTATDAGAAEPATSDTGGPALSTNPRCEGLDLHAIAERAPRLTSLRISGCQAAVHAGLSAFGPRLQHLELVDLDLDAVTVARLSQLHGLESLALTRVTAEPDALNPLGRKISPQTLVLRELVKDSPVSEAITILRDLRHLRLEGAWANHNTMIRVGRAKKLRSLAVVDATIGNYSLHQIKTLDHLHRIEWRGSGFNDSSPQYIRDLPVDELICDCQRFGDRGLHMLRFFEGLQILDLERSQITSAGLAHLTELQALDDITIRYREFDSEAFAAFATLPKLRRLILSPGTLTDPEAAGLGLLVGLRELEIDLEGFDDRAARELATLVELERLDLGNTAISDAGLEHLAQMHRLRELELHHTRVTKHGLQHLAGLTRLELLELDHTDLVDEGVAHLAGLHALRELRLDHTLITDAALPHLLGLVNLRRLNLAQTVVTADGVAALEQLPNLEAVNLADTRAVD